MPKVNVNEGYELYQIITDFGDPLEIFREGIQNSFDEFADMILVHVYERPFLGGNELRIDIIDNGNGLKRENISNFFDLANSSKVDEEYVPIGGKHGYKGHGSKVFFNAQEVQICSKTRDGDYWAANLKNPIEQISKKSNNLEYSEILRPSDIDIELPSSWASGFMVRIIAPRHFATQQTRSKLSHIFLRDYCKWYTIIGSIETLYNNNLRNRNVRLYLCGLNMDSFKSKYTGITEVDPVPTFEDCPFGLAEEIKLGHYFPPQRSTDTAMDKYSRSIGSTKASYMYYSKMAYNDIVSVSGLTIRVVISLEGYETKRRYDLLLSKQGRLADLSIDHTDGARYGLWACKGGVPVEKIDDWIEGGRGIGTYTFMQGFVDCGDFQLTANRGSIRNTNIEKLDIIKQEVNKIFNSKKVEDALQERRDWEAIEKVISSVKEDEKNLKIRYSTGKNKRLITLPDGTTLFEPAKTKSGYSESETFVVLLTLMEHYPDLFTFKILDYNTTKGIDFVVDYLGTPKYIELKGSLTKKINHPFKLVYKFICYEIDVNKNEIIEDIDTVKATLRVNQSDDFISPNFEFNKIKYTSYVLQPETARAESMEIIQLKTILTEILKATIR